MRPAVTCAATGLLTLVLACASAPRRPAPLGLPVAPPATEPASRPAGSAPAPGPYAAGWDVLHYDIELALPDGPGWIAGHTTIRAKRTAGGDAVLPLDLVGLAAVRVVVDGRAVPPAHTAGRLSVPTGAAVGDTVEVAVTYAGVPDDGLVLGRTVHGRPSAFADNWPDRARYWFPSVDHPSDKATVAFTVHAPAAWKVVANGALVGSPVPTPEETGGAALPRRTWRWRSDVPIPTYTMVVGGAEFAVDTVGSAACGLAPASRRADGCVTVTRWLFPEDRDRGAASFRRASRMVDLYADWIGPFPYEKLAHVQSATRFGGMENATAIFYSERALAAGYDIEGTVAHETAHQWFGDSVTEEDWHHLWLSEGFATYFAALFYEWEDGEAAFRREMEEARRGYLGSDVVDRPVIDPEADDLFDLLNANSYQKGAWVLHMLRGLAGDVAFQRAIRAYFTHHRDGTALTEGLRREMEAATGVELGWFFEQWLHRPGYPVLRVSHRWEAGAGEVVVEVEQVQREGWPRFRIPTEVLVRGPWGERREAVELRGNRTSVRIEAPGPADAVVVDPGGWVLGQRADDAPSGDGE